MPFEHAPLQGMGETYEWLTNDISPVQFDTSNGNGAFTLAVAADVNGYSWNIQFGGVNINSSPVTSPLLGQSAYAERNSQFARLASLWHEYRVEHVGFEYQPVAPGGTVNITAAVSVFDETSELISNQAKTDLVEKLSSYKNVHLHTPYKVMKHKCDYHKWLGQAQDTCWRNTQAPGVTQIIREFYATPQAILAINQPNLLPSLAFAASFNFSGATIFPGTIGVGVIIFKTKYTFRLRKALTSDPFLDRTLLYENLEEDGSATRHSLTITESEMKEIFRNRQEKSVKLSDQSVATPSISLDEQKDNILIEAKPLELTKSVLMANLQEMFSTRSQVPLTQDSAPRESLDQHF